MAWSPDHSSRWSRKSTMPASAHCRSSMTMTTGRYSARRSKKRRQPEKSSSLAEHLGRRQAQQLAEARGDELPVGCVSDPALEAGPQPLGDHLRRVLLADLEPCPDHLRERPVARPPRRRTGSARRARDVSATRPSMYLKNSQARRDLPTPATPETSTSLAEWRSAEAWKSSLTRRSSWSRPMKGGLEDSRALRAGDGRDDPGRLEEPHRLGLALQLVLAGIGVGDRRRGGGPRRLVDVAAPRRGGRLDAGGGVHTVADDETLLGGLGRGGAAGHDPDARLEVGSVLGAVGGNGRDELEARSHRALRVVLLCDRGAPDRHDGVADELLDDARRSGRRSPGRARSNPTGAL